MTIFWTSLKFFQMRQVNLGGVGDIYNIHHIPLKQSNLKEIRWAEPEYKNIPLPEY